MPNEFKYRNGERLSIVPKEKIAQAGSRATGQFCISKICCRFSTWNNDKLSQQLKP